MSSIIAHTSVWWQVWKFSVSGNNCPKKKVWQSVAKKYTFIVEQILNMTSLTVSAQNEFLANRWRAILAKAVHYRQVPTTQLQHRLARGSQDWRGVLWLWPEVTLNHLLLGWPPMRIRTQEGTWVTRTKAHPADRGRRSFWKLLNNCPQRRSFFKVSFNIFVLQFSWEYAKSFPYCNLATLCQDKKWVRKNLLTVQDQHQQLIFQDLPIAIECSVLIFLWLSICIIFYCYPSQSELCFLLLWRAAHH